MSDTPSDIPPVRPAPARSVRQVLELLYVGITTTTDVQEDQCLFIDSIPRRERVRPTLVITFADGETWYIDAEREQT